MRNKVCFFGVKDERSWAGSPVVVFPGRNLGLNPGSLQPLRPIIKYSHSLQKKKVEDYFFVTLQSLEYIGQ